MHQKLNFLRNPRHPAQSTSRSPTSKHAHPKWGSPEKERRLWHAKVGVLQLCWLLATCQDAGCGASALQPEKILPAADQGRSAECCAGSLLIASCTCRFLAGCHS